MNPYAFAVGALGHGVGTGINLYNQSRQRDFYNYQRSGYDRQLKDWNRNVGSQHRRIRYPELSYEGRIRGTDRSIESSYLGSAGSVAGLTGSIGSGLVKYLG